MFDSQFESAEMTAALSRPRLIARLLAFESALAQAQGELGLIPAGAAHSIVAACADPKLPESIDLDGASIAGNAAIPFVRQLTERLHRQQRDASAWVHYGATSQDAIDTSVMLSLRDAFVLIARDLDTLRATLAVLAKLHVRTVMPARTLLQQAAPTTFGFKVASWLAALDDSARRMRDTTFTVQLGGPVGTLALAGDKAQALIERVAAILDLASPSIAWHTSRERIVAIGATLATLTGQLGKIARDVALEMQTEVGELVESSAPGKGGSSAMPHKRNPVDSLVAIAASQITPQLAAGLLTAMMQEHERGVGGWHAEFVLLPRLCHLTHRATSAVLSVATGLHVDADRMRANIGLTAGLLSAANLAAALSATLGRERAHDVVQTLSRTALAEHKHLRDIAQRDLPKLGVTHAPATITAAFDIDRELDAAQARALHYLDHRDHTNG
jgi:3-carboxy-cis,cis-muconate cycloisomerase